MAKVLNQGFSPMTKELDDFVPEMESLKGKMLVEIPHIFNAFLVDLLAKEKINVENVENVEVDAYGNPFISLGDTRFLLPKKEINVEVDAYGNPFISVADIRISLAVALVAKNGICVYKRKGNELNFNDGVDDVIGSVGYGTPSLFFKVPPELWQTKVKSAKIAQNYAWEITDCVGDKEIVKMPIIILQMEDVFCTVQVEDIENPTAKMQVVIKELKNK